MDRLAFAASVVARHLPVRALLLTVDVSGGKPSQSLEVSLARPWPRIPGGQVDAGTFADRIRSQREQHPAAVGWNKRGPSPPHRSRRLALRVAASSRIRIPGFPPFAAATRGGLEDPLACSLGKPGNEPLAYAVSHRPELLKPCQGTFRAWFRGVSIRHSALDQKSGPPLACRRIKEETSNLWPKACRAAT